MLLIEWTSTAGIATGLAGWPSCRLRDRVLLSIRGWAVPVIPQGLLCWSCQALVCRQGAGWTPPAVGWPSGVTPPPAGHTPLSLLSCLSRTSPRSWWDALQRLLAPAVYTGSAPSCGGSGWGWGSGLRPSPPACGLMGRGESWSPRCGLSGCLTEVWRFICLFRVIRARGSNSRASGPRRPVL